MKRMVLFLAALGMTAALYAQTEIPAYQFIAGSWNFVGERLYQNDANARLAKVNFEVPQKGVILYEFNARYERGAEDGHGGFGIHVFGDTVTNIPSWGSGVSYLLWLNYDENPTDSAIPRGLSAQVYRSYTHSRMEIVESFDLNYFDGFLIPEYLANPVPIKIIVDGNTGEVRVFDPTVPALDEYYSFYVNQKDLPLAGNWVVLRTNGIQLSFALGL